MSETISIQQKREATESIRRFAELPREKQIAALLVVRGIQIGEEAAQFAQDSSTEEEKEAVPVITD